MLKRNMSNDTKKYGEEDSEKGSVGRHDVLGGFLDSAVCVQFKESIMN